MNAVVTTLQLTWGRRAAAAFVLSLLAACGSGGAEEPGGKPAIGSANNSSETVNRPSVTLALTDSAGAASTFVTQSKPLTATATLLDKSGKPIPNALVAFNVDSTLALVSPASGTVTTDAQGKARVTIVAASAASAGAGRIEVVATAGEATAETSMVFSASPVDLTLQLISPDVNPLRLRAYDSSVITLDLYSDGKLMKSDAVAVSFTSSCASMGKATLPEQAFTVNGRVQVVYRDQGCAQSDTITATATGAKAAVKVNVEVASPEAASIQVSNVEPADRSIVIKGSGGNGRTETALITFTVVDQFGKPVANRKVTFSTISSQPVTLSKDSDVTDENGQVVTALNAGTTPTAVRVRATLDSGMTTVSDSITVTTGAPIQAAFSLSAETYNMEGWSYDDIHNNVNLLLADQFGNPVADGVPVVFQTDSGAIGTAERGGCTTVNGQCSVVLRSQNPRYGTDAGAPQGRAGLATITVSTLGETATPLTGKLGVFMSGSTASTITALRTGFPEQPVGESVTFRTLTCDTFSTQLRISDARRNPMPSGTTLALADAFDLEAGTVYPDTVPVISPRYTNGRVLGDQGSVHLIPMKPDEAKCDASGTRTATGSMILQITTPQGNVTAVRIGLTYPSK